MIIKFLMHIKVDIFYLQIILISFFSFFYKYVLVEKKSILIIYIYIYNNSNNIIYMYDIYIWEHMRIILETNFDEKKSFITLKILILLFRYHYFIILFRIILFFYLIYLFLIHIQILFFTYRILCTFHLIL